MLIEEFLKGGLWEGGLQQGYHSEAIVGEGRWTVGISQSPNYEPAHGGHQV